ncbi:MAG: hypothetical protein ABFS02_10095 [Pseudomonadota bacterium]
MSSYNNVKAQLTRAELSKVHVNPGNGSLILLPIRRRLMNSAELLSSRRMSLLMAELEGRYPDRIVIYELQPLLTSDDSLVTSFRIDATLLVVPEGKARVGEF